MRLYKAVQETLTGMPTLIREADNLEVLEHPAVVAALAAAEQRGRGEGPPVDWYTEVFRRAVQGKTLEPERMLAYFADRNNWRQVHAEGRCWWAWCGPTIPPYEGPARVIESGAHQPPTEDSS